MADIFTTVGENVVTDYITGDASAPANYYIHWGTGVAAATKADTTLGTAGSESRVAAVESQPAADTAQWVATLTADGTKTISEVGLFDASTAGNMLIHADHAGIALALGDKIEYTITLQAA